MRISFEVSYQQVQGIESTCVQLSRQNWLIRYLRQSKSAPSELGKSLAVTQSPSWRVALKSRAPPIRAYLSQTFFMAEFQVQISIIKRLVNRQLTVK